jgi:pSer/pThr/pTyr-binding forkhead associated (FHA) protein
VKRYYLVFETGSPENTTQKTIYPLLEATTIGRDTKNAISLPDATASRKHARVRFWQGSWVVEDLRSANGIIFNDERVETVSLKPGDSFKIGKTSFSLVVREIAESKDPLQTTVEFLSATIGGMEAPVHDDVTEKKSARLKDAISDIPFFAPLQDSEREQLAEAATMHVFNRGELIIREGDPGRSIYIILDGRVKVFTRDRNCNELGLATLGVGQFFGEMSLVSGKPRSSSVVTLDSSVLVELSSASMIKVIKENEAVKEVLLDYFKARKQDTLEKRAKVKFSKQSG